ncbi:hypothetical protein [Paracidovorax valerianellae]|uniref:Uncharacterized protein n=1 Tax=Paracidovorax valerianellae TaxID=187868 RepID=A0A1G7AZM7_9BURK|nr:hypothetical protein [Paracidovorax valerianellae]MDA8445657.1 hypothetical protein [Paracidovorax valerianellae]SDE20152.1 hypothetical protein SAMN05192589_113114 [Paracidovorax valerianellae]
MTNILRPIAIHVEEPAPGAFSWVLIERDDGHVDTWTPIRKAETAADTYQQAMADGLLALQSMVEDLDIGPRLTAREGWPRKDHRSDSAPQADDSEDAQQRPAKPSLFGFGPAR